MKFFFPLWEQHYFNVKSFEGGISVFCLWDGCPWLRIWNIYCSDTSLVRISLQLCHCFLAILWTAVFQVEVQEEYNFITNLWWTPWELKVCSHLCWSRPSNSFTRTRANILLVLCFCSSLFYVLIKMFKNEMSLVTYILILLLRRYSRLTWVLFEIYLCDLLWQGVWTGWSLEIPSNTYNCDFVTYLDYSIYIICGSPLSVAQASQDVGHSCSRAKLINSVYMTQVTLRCPYASLLVVLAFALALYMQYLWLQIAKPELVGRVKPGISWALTRGNRLEGWHVFK